MHPGETQPNSQTNVWTEAATGTWAKASPAPTRAALVRAGYLVSETCFCNMATAGNAGGLTPDRNVKSSDMKAPSMTNKEMLGIVFSRGKKKAAEAARLAKEVTKRKGEEIKSKIDERRDGPTMQPLLRTVASQPHPRRLACAVPVHTRKLARQTHVQLLCQAPISMSTAWAPNLAMVELSLPMCQVCHATALAAQFISADMFSCAPRVSDSTLMGLPWLDDHASYLCPSANPLLRALVSASAAASQRSGWMEKRGAMNRSFKRRWFEVRALAFAQFRSRPAPVPLFLRTHARRHMRS